MFTLRGALAVGLALAVTAGTASAAPNQPFNQRLRSGSAGRGIEGVVVAVHHDRSPRGAGWIKIRHVRHHRSGRRGGIGAAAALGRLRSRGRGNVQTYHVNRSTRFERNVRGGNGQVSNRRTSFAALRHGERVRIVPGSGRQRAARLVDILSYGSGGQRSYRRHVAPRPYYSRYGRYHGHRRRPFVVRRYNVNRPVVTRMTVVRPVRHTLIAGRVARANRPVVDVRRRVVAHQASKKPVNTARITHKMAPSKPKPRPAAKPPAHKPKVMHTNQKPPSHKPGHSKPRSSSHRKR